MPAAQQPPASEEPPPAQQPPPAAAPPPSVSQTAATAAASSLFLAFFGALVLGGAAVGAVLYFFVLSADDRQLSFLDSITGDQAGDSTPTAASTKTASEDSNSTSEGGAASAGDTTSGGSSASSDDGNSGSGSGSGAKPPASELIPPPIVLADIPPVPVPLTGSTTDDLIGGSNDAAAEALAQALQDAGLNLAGIDVFVFPISGTNTGLLVLNINEGQAFLGEDPTPFVAMLTAPEIAANNIDRIVINFSGVDGDLTLTVPVSTLLAAFLETISPEQLLTELLLEAR